MTGCRDGNVRLWDGLTPASFGSEPVGVAVRDVSAVAINDRLRLLIAPAKGPAVIRELVLAADAILGRTAEWTLGDSAALQVVLAPTADGAPALAAHVHGATYRFFLAPTAPDSGRALLTLSAPGDATLTGTLITEETASAGVVLKYTSGSGGGSFTGPRSRLWLTFATLTTASPTYRQWAMESAHLTTRDKKAFLHWADQWAVEPGVTGLRPVTALFGWTGAGERLQAVVRLNRPAAGELAFDPMTHHHRLADLGDAAESLTGTVALSDGTTLTRLRAVLTRPVAGDRWLRWPAIGGWCVWRGPRAGLG